MRRLILLTLLALALPALAQAQAVDYNNPKYFAGRVVAGIRSNAGELAIKEPGSGQDTVTLDAPVLASSITLTLPDSLPAGTTKLLAVEIDGDMVYSIDPALIGSGSVSGNGTDNRVARWDGTDDIQDSLWALSDGGDMTVSDGSLHVTSANGNNTETALSTSGSVAANLYFALREDGAMTWGDGAGSIDTGLLRPSANVLQLGNSDALTFTGQSGDHSTAPDGSIAYDSNTGKLRGKEGGVWDDLIGGSGGGAPTNATYITQTANGSLSNEQALGALGSGYMKSTTTTGVVSTTATIPHTDIDGGTVGQIVYFDASGILTHDSGLYWNPAVGAPGNWLALHNQDVAGARLRGYEDSDNGSNYLLLQFPNSLAANTTWSAPSVTTTEVTAQATGTAKFLTANTSGDRVYVQPVFLDLGAGTSAELASIISDEVGTGRAVFSDSPTLTGTVSAANITATGNVSVIGNLGYRTGNGTGGTVAQATNKATGVTLNKLSGEITLASAALAGGAEVTFTVTNSTVATTDRIILNLDNGGTSGAYNAYVSAVGAGSFNITVSNMTGGSLNEQPVIGFMVLKAATD